jgi:N-acetylneuraminate synthase
MEKLIIGNRSFGCGESPYVIAEIGSNHNGDMNLCRQLIDAAKKSGVDAVKFQSWTDSTLVSRSEYEKNTTYVDTKRHFGSLEEMVKAYQFTPEQHYEISAYCLEHGVQFLSSAFSEKEVDLLESLDVPMHKIASMDINNYRLLKYIGQTGKPVALSTGMASLGEIEKAVHLLQENCCGQIILLHCISIYPPDYRDIHLRNIPMLEQAFGLPVGFSDHSMGISIPLAAVALGACMIEKHFTLDRDMEGWDHWISATPEEMKGIVEEGRNITQALGVSVRTVSQDELEKRKKFRRCIVAARDLPKGHKIGFDDVDFKRPGDGIHPEELSYVLGRSICRALTYDEKITWADLA